MKSLIEYLNFRDLLLLFSSASLLSCSPSFYSPANSNIPLCVEPDETHVSVAGSLSEDIGGFEVQFAHSFEKRQAMMLNYYAASGSASGTYGSYYNGEGSYGEAAYGYYRSVEDLILEGYGGLGYGKVKVGGRNSNFDANIIKLFVQPNIGISSKIGDIGFSPRIGWLNYKNVKWSGTSMNQQAEYINAHKGSFMFEPTFVMKIGFKVVRLNISYTYSTNLSNPKIAQQRQNFSIGLFVNFADRYML